MADLIIACPRRGHPRTPVERLRKAALRLAPPEVPVREPLALEHADVAGVVANPTGQGVWLYEGSDEAAAGGAICIGGLFGEPGSWWRTGAEAPDGTYGLVRWDAHSVELVADICATRTLWYALS